MSDVYSSVPMKKLWTLFSLVVFESDSDWYSQVTVFSHECHIINHHLVGTLREAQARRCRSSPLPSKEEHLRWPLHRHLRQGTSSLMVRKEYSRSAGVSCG